MVRLEVGLFKLIYINFIVKFQGYYEQKMF